MSVKSNLSDAAEVAALTWDRRSFGEKGSAFRLRGVRVLSASDTDLNLVDGTTPGFKRNLQNIAKYRTGKS